MLDACNAFYSATHLFTESSNPLFIHDCWPATQEVFSAFLYRFFSRETQIETTVSDSTTDNYDDDVSSSHVADRICRFLGIILAFHKRSPMDIAQALAQLNTDILTIELIEHLVQYLPNDAEVKRKVEHRT